MRFLILPVLAFAAMAAVADPPAPVYTEEAVKTIMQGLHTKEDVIKFFGEPAFTSQDGPAKEILYYMFPQNFPKNQASKHIFSGMEVIFVNGKVTEWRPSYGDKN